MNNKNNSANTAEERSNNTMLYGVIGLLVLLIIIVGGYFWYMSDGAEKKKNGDSKEATTKAQLDQLIKYDFLSEECSKAIEEYKKSKTEENKKKLQGLLKGKIEDIQKDYTQKAENIDKCQISLKSMRDGRDIGGLESSLKEFFENNISKLPKKKDDKDQQGKQNEKIQTNIKQALEQVEKAKKAAINKERREALKKAEEALNNCVKNTKWLSWWRSDALIKKDNQNYEPVKKEIEKIGNILKNVPKEGDVAQYSDESLEKQLETWNKEYQTINDQNKVAITLKKANK
ncbi:MAG: hypothetical protein AAF900_01120 [Bacteroidota bacterium]